MDIEQLAREAGFTENMGRITARHSSGAWVAVDDRLQTFANLVRNAVLEEAAVKCEEISIDKWSLYKGSKPYTGQEPGRADDFTQGQSSGADLCEDAIRSMKKE